ncbi:MAG: hypothetical protein K6G86_07760 [Bacteroidales bacterium]|nr:hypothetical protein [Bacteroidales bacterium]
MDAQSNPVTSLSAGLLIREILSQSSRVSAVSNKVYPIVSEADSKLPYICYRRAGLKVNPVKTAPGADSAIVEVLCYAQTYKHSVQMAEAVREALDGVQAEIDLDDDGGQEENGGAILAARSITLSDAGEGWADDAYFQSLTFVININNYE